MGRAPKNFGTSGFWLPGPPGAPFVLICLHGMGGSKDDFLSIEQDLYDPRLNFFYLDGIERDYDGWSWYLNPNDLMPAHTVLTRVMHSLNSIGFPPRRCFLLGFSQGGTMVLEFGARFPHVLAGYVCISGRVENYPLLVKEANPGIIQKASWLVTHGIEDKRLSIDTTRDQILNLQQRGWHIDYQEYLKGHTFDFQRELPMIRLWLSHRMHSLSSL